MFVANIIHNVLFCFKGTLSIRQCQAPWTCCRQLRASISLLIALEASATSKPNMRPSPKKALIHFVCVCVYTIPIPKQSSFLHCVLRILFPAVVWSEIILLTGPMLIVRLATSSCVNIFYEPLSLTPTCYFIHKRITLDQLDLNIVNGAFNQSVKSTSMKCCRS